MKKFLKIFAMLAIALVTLCSLVACRNSAEESDTEIVPVDLEKLGEYTELTPGTGGTAGDDKTYVTFGVWPQTIKADSVTVDKNTSESKDVGMFTYYKGDDDNWYCDAQENAYGTGNEYKYSDGTKVSQKGAGSSKWFKVEPIKWRVLTTDFKGADSTAWEKKLLFAESGLYASVPYYDVHDVARNINGKTIYPNNYEHSRIRAWLNGIVYNKSGTNSDELNNKGFLQTAFTAGERAKIAETVVDNSVTSTGYSTNTYACDNTNDKVFLLSYSEAFNNTYFADDKTRIRKPTDFALANHAYKDRAAAYGGCFFVRSPYYNDSNEFRIVGNSGASNRSTVYYRFPVVVPALCVN